MSIEPLLEDFRSFNVCDVDWVIIGAQSGKGKGVIKPEKAWVERISCYCKTKKIPVFMKDSLTELMGNEHKVQFPALLNSKRPSQKLSANCMECGGNFRKSDMTYILTRKGKERGAKSLGSICSDCYTLLHNRWFSEGGDDIE